MTVTHLPRVDGPDDEPGPGGPDHPMRKVTTQVAFDPGGWTPERAAKVESLFDELAVDWHARFRPGREGALVDALDRGEVPAGRCLELGSGVGLVSGLLADRMAAVVAVDLSAEMLRRAPTSPPRVRADASRLGFADATFDVIVLQNMLLFPGEVDRLLVADGTIVWVNSSGPTTPIHLTADELDRALPGAWAVTASEHGRGTWAVARRAS